MRFPAPVLTASLALITACGGDDARTDQPTAPAPAAVPATPAGGGTPGSDAGAGGSNAGAGGSGGAGASSNAGAGGAGAGAGSNAGAGGAGAVGGANAGGAQGGTAGAAGAGTAGAGGGDNQLPPTSAAALEAWLAAGHYKAWACQPAPHPANPPGAHGANRICSNAKLSGAGEAGAFPESSANVKEVWDKPGGKIVGYAVYVKTKPTSDGGANLWWYERIGTSVYANGFGDSGGAKTICVDCHKTASTTFAPTSRDFVFTQVK